MARRGLGGKLTLGAGVVVLLAAMALDTKVVKSGDSAAEAGVFEPASYGAAEFPKVRADVEKRAVDAPVLAAAIAKDQDTAAKQYGVAADAGPEFPVKFTGKAGKPDFGVTEITVPGMPDGVHVTVQTGPAINGTDLRDASGTIAFGQFRNQIDYQNAGSALNKQMKKVVLSKIDTAGLEGKTVSVVGVFQLSDPSTWLVTPVTMDVK
jgi:predicted lipoprotein